MRTMTKVLTVTAALVVALSLAAPISANCGTTALIQTRTATGNSFIFSPAFAAHPSFYYGPYGPTAYGTDAPAPLSAAANITFWAEGRGDPAVGLGDDNGAYDMIATGGFYFYGYGASYAGGYGFAGSGEIFGTWEGGTDGCVNGLQCMCLLITDQDGDTGFFASVGGMSDTGVNTSFNRGGADAGNNNLPIALAAIAAPSITGSARDAVSLDVDFTVKLAAPTAGVYNAEGTACGCGPIGFIVREQILMRGALPPSNRDGAGWTLPLKADGTAQTMAAFGAGATDPGVVISSACGASDTDVYLSTQLVFDSGFGTTVVSGNSTRVECGPTLADPSARPRPNRPTRGRPDNPRRR